MSQPVSELPKFVTGFFNDICDVLFEMATNVKERMSEADKPSASPVQWDSKKQRRAYFASNGFGAGIPYKRTGAYQASWTVTREALGTTLHAPSPAGAVGGIPGGWQSSIHRSRWNNITVVLFEELAKIPEAISNKFEVRAK